MKITLDIPDYNPQTGINYKWENGFEITVIANHGTVSITANKAGLISLANHFLNLAQDNIPPTSHMHFDSHNSLEENSVELIIEKK